MLDVKNLYDLSTTFKETLPVSLQIQFESSVNVSGFSLGVDVYSETNLFLQRFFPILLQINLVLKYTIN